MTIKTITFQQTFPTGPYMNQKLGVEMEITDADYAACNDQEDVVANVAFDTAKKLVNDAFHAMNGGEAEWKSGEPYKIGTTQPIPEIQVEKTDSTIEALKKDILEAPSLQILGTWKLVVQANPELQNAYDQRFIELQNK